MMRKWLLAPLAIVLMTPAAAQMQIQRIQRPIQVQPMPAPQAAEDNSDIAEKVMTVEEARARISQLLREKREANAKLAEALATIEQMTSRSGSLVRAYCEGNLSRNTAGATENCGDSGYVCNDVDGLCKRSCQISTDCATSFTCDPASNKCVRTG